MFHCPTHEGKKGSHGTRNAGGFPASFAEFRPKNRMFALPNPTIRIVDLCAD